MAVLALAPDRRTAERIHLGFQIVVNYNDGTVRWTETDATLVDVSQVGMFVRSDRTPRDGQRILVHVMHNRRGLCAAWGHAVRFDGWGGFGVNFRRINDSLSGFIGELALANAYRRSEIMESALDARIWIDSSDSE